MHASLFIQKAMYCYYIFDNKSRFWYREQTVLAHLHLCTSIKKKFHFFISASNKMSLFLNLNMQKGYSKLKMPFKPWTVCLYVQHFVISPLPSQPNPPLHQARVGVFSDDNVYQYKRLKANSFQNQRFQQSEDGLFCQLP